MGSEEALHIADPEVTATAEQPLRAAPFDVKAMLPVGASPATVAENVTAWPQEDGFALEIMAVAEAALLTTCDNAVLVLVR